MRNLYYGTRAWRRFLRWGRHVLSLVVLSILATACDLPWTSSGADFPPEYFENWGHYLGDPARTHYSALEQINTHNVQDLEVAWIYHSENGDSTGYIQASPLVRHGTLYSNPRI